jgi:hypothetical protein
MRKSVAATVNKLDKQLSNWFDLNSEIVRLGRQNDLAFKLLRVPTAKTAQALSAAPAEPTVENPGVEKDRLQKALKDAEQHLANAKRLGLFPSAQVG